MSKYDDIIKQSRPISKHTKMSIQNRAGQFAPFAALTGYNEAVNETIRSTDEKNNIDEDTKTILDNTLQLIIKNIKEKPKVSITYFVKDKKKEGGSYINIIDNVKKTDEIYKIIYLNNQKISIKDIKDIKLL